MLNSFMKQPIKGYKLVPTASRTFAGVADIKSKFHEAWLEGQSSQRHASRAPKNTEEYGNGYYQKWHKGLKKGYTHPYHSKDHPLFYSNIGHQFKLFSDMVGPEQVSPHYESFFRSRRGVILTGLYIGAVASFARLGGWDNNEWLRGMIFHHEYLIALYIGFAEVRHFAWIPGPKFTNFYEVYSRYETKQLAAQWSDVAEQLSTEFFHKSKQQVDFMQIHKEYKFIKKRAMVTFLTNERQNLEKHFHDRTLSMLRNITSYEEQNLKNKLSSIAQAALKATLEKVENDEGGIKEQSFNDALEGIRNGKMDYKEDPVLPILKEEITKRTAELKGLSPEEESRMLSLTDDQRKSVAQADRAAKDAYLTSIPHLTSQGLKAHKKFTRFADYLGGLNKREA